MQSTRWRRAAGAAKNFARAPLPTLAVWIGDALSWISLDLWGRAIEWRIKREASPHAATWAGVDGVLMFWAVVLIVAVL